MVKRQSYVLQNTTQRTAVIIEPFGTDESDPYAHAGKCTIQKKKKKSLPIGTHKCVPYEHNGTNSVNSLKNDHADESRYAHI